MTYNPNHDRSYWRCKDISDLIEAARYSPDELAIALGERLEELDDTADRLDDALRERDELDRRCDALREELEALRTAVEADRRASATGDHE